MTVSIAKQATARFYEWEVLGRGLLLGSSPIDLEPPFTPFFGHAPFSPLPCPDDGVHHTIFSGIASLFKKKEQLPLRSEVSISYDPIASEHPDTLSFLHLLISRHYQGSMSEAEQFLAMLSYCTSPLSVEFIATDQKIALQCTSRSNDASYLLAQLKSCFPKLGVSIGETDMLDQFDSEKAVAVTDFGLEEEFMRPLAIGFVSGMDPLINLFSVLHHLQAGEEVMVQILFNGLVNQWEESMLSSVTTRRGEAFFVDSPEMLPMCREKIASPLLACSIRILAQADSFEEAMAILEKTAFAIRRTSKSKGNALVPLPHAEYTIEQRIEDIVLRQSHRTGMLLNIRELATFIHIPTLYLPKLWGCARRTKAAPLIAIGQPMVIGINEHEGKRLAATLSNSLRLRHMHIVGATGTGKSTLLKSMICQDIDLGNGVGVLDPHGDLIDEILASIPRSRVQDVILVDPSDEEFPLSFNMLHAHSAIEREILSSDLVAGFRRNSTSWGDQMNSVFANAITAFLDSSTGGTLADLRRFLIEKGFRDEFLQTVSDPSIRYYWQKEYPLLKTTSIGPILTRLDTFLRPRIIRNMVCQSKGLGFGDVLDTKKIILVKLSQGMIGRENSYLLGTLFVSKIHQASFARQNSADRPDFFLYIDEFHQILTPSMEEMLSGGRKYHVGLVLAHQNLQQLQKHDNALSGAIMGNVATQICFRVGESDAKKLCEGFSFFEAADLQNLAVGEAIARIERPDFDFSFSTIEKKHTDDTNLQNEIITFSRSHYCRPLAEVEEALSRTLYSEALPELKHTTPKSNTQAVPKESKEAPVSYSAPPIDSVIARKEQTQHRYLQNLIKKMGEARGYKGIIESEIIGSREKVDVLLEKENLTIACEVSVTTDTAWEMHNIRKCLDAGYTIIVSCLTEPKLIVKMKRITQMTFLEQDLKRIKVFTPEELFQFLDESSMGLSPSEITYKGYRVKVQYDQLSLDEMNRKREAVTRVVFDALKKIKK